MELVGQLEVVVDAEDGLGDLHGYSADPFQRRDARPARPTGLRWGGGVDGGVVAAIEDAVDGGGERGGHLLRASCEDGGPRGFEEDVGDAGVAVEQDGNAALEGLDGGDAVALDGGHEEEMGLVVEGLEFGVGDEAVEVDAAGDAELGGELGERGELRAGAGDVEIASLSMQREAAWWLPARRASGESSRCACWLRCGRPRAGEACRRAGWGGCGRGWRDGGGEAAHARDVGFDVEVAAALGAEDTRW